MSTPNCFRVDEIEKTETHAFKALANGEASPEQQKLVLSVIVKKLSRTHDVLFIPGAPDETNFLNGRSFVGLQIVKRIKTPFDQLHPEEAIDNGRSSTSSRTSS